MSQQGCESVLHHSTWCTILARLSAVVMGRLGRARRAVNSGSTDRAGLAMLPVFSMGRTLLMLPDGDAFCSACAGPECTARVGVSRGARACVARGLARRGRLALASRCRSRCRVTVRSCVASVVQKVSASVATVSCMLCICTSCNGRMSCCYILLLRVCRYPGRWCLDRSIYDGRRIP